MLYQENWQPWLQVVNLSQAPARAIKVMEVTKFKIDAKNGSKARKKIEKKLESRKISKKARKKLESRKSSKKARKSSKADFPTKKINCKHFLFCCAVFRHAYILFVSVKIRVARWYIFKPKIPIWVNL
jgi:hypothetical protein